MKPSRDTRGVAYIALGPARFLDEALASLRSLRRATPDLPAVLFTDAHEMPPPDSFDRIVRVQGRFEGRRVGAANWDAPGWLTRIDIFASLPFDRTLFIDTDTEIVGDIAGVLDILDRFDVAAAHAAYRYRGDIAGIPASFPEFNCGVVAIRKSDATRAFLAQWRELYLADSRFWHHDQHAFRAAAWAGEARIAVLPQEYNLRPPRYAGLSAPKILHGYTRSGPDDAGARKIRFLSDDHGMTHHRAGWNLALSALRPLTHPNGVLLDSMIENTYGWGFARYRDYLPMREPWIGIAHNPPHIPAGYFDDVHPQALLRRSRFQESLASCLGLFALSEYHARWLRAETGKPVEVLHHPVAFDVPRFCPEALLGSFPRPLIHVGWWLRRFESFSRLEAGGYAKTVLRLQDRNARACIAKVSWADDVDFVDWLPHGEYDALLARAVVFVDLIDCSANNVVVDCIARATPLLINRHPALEEYLGADYPLFYDDLEHAGKLLHDDEAVLAASRHMQMEQIRRPLSPDNFRQSLRESRIYSSLPPC